MQAQKRKRKQDSPLEEIIRYTRKIPRFKALNKHLKTLNKMIGMEDIKKSIVSQIQFIITTGGKLDQHFLNTVLQGPPGTGKTTVAEILYNIWISLDIFDDDIPFTILHRSDFVGSYMGHTSNKTRKLLNKHAGGVIFIDEAYSLMNGDKDEYGKEALDQLNAFMGEEKSNTIIIIAGYEDNLQTNFFDANAGLKRRFGWFFSIKQYSHKELFQIFQRQLSLCDWSVHKKCEKLFEEYYSKFKNAGGDTANICFQAKLAYSKTNWMKRRQTKHLTYDHVKQGMENYFTEEERDYELNMYI